MQILFDHLGALFVAGGIVLIFSLIQMRGTQTATEAAINYQVVSELTEISNMLQRDLENMRTQAQTDEAINRGNFIGGTGYDCQLATSSGLTTTLTFPTLSNPDSAAVLSDPDDATVTLVTYSLTDTGKTIEIPENGVDNTLPIYTLDRLVDGVVTGGSGEYVIHFLTEFSSQGSNTFSSTSATCSSNLAKVRFEIKVATEGVGWITTDQESSSQLNISRYGSTVSMANME